MKVWRRQENVAPGDVDHRQLLEDPTTAQELASRTVLLRRKPITARLCIQLDLD